jgi:hypothetical protein
VIAVAGLSACGGGLPLSAAKSTAPASTPTSLPAPRTPSIVSPPATTPVPKAPSTTTPGTTRVKVPTLLDPRSGTALLRSVLAHAIAQHWVHGVATSPATRTDAATTFTSDDGPGDGIQDITVGSVSGQIRVVGDRTYIRGTPAALVDLFQVPIAVAPELGGRWVTLKPGDSDYHTVTIGVTISSFIGEIAFTGAVTEGTSRVDGVTTTIIEGRLPASAGKGTGVLYLTGTTDPLPQVWEEIGSSSTTRTTFDQWGQAVTVTAPAGATPLPTTPGGTSTAAAVVTTPSRRA